MSDIEQSQPGAVSSPLDKWNVFREMIERDGFNIAEAWGKLIVEQYQWLSSSVARKDFEELCEVGCNPIVLVSIIGLSIGQASFMVS